MGVKTFEIQFHKNCRVFNGGNTIKGHVILDFDKETKARAITIRFVGSSQVQWSEKSMKGLDKIPKTRQVADHETYFDTKQILVSAENSSSPDDTQTIPEGCHSYPFEFELPLKIPSSYEGPYGRVRYYIECNVDRPWKFDYRVKVAFSVNSVYDLNECATAAKPKASVVTRTPGVMCCKSGPITVRLKLERSGYVPGEVICVQQGIVDNQSSKTLESNSLIFQQVVTFKAGKKTKITEKNIIHLRRQGVNGDSSEDWGGQRIHIPPLPPSKFEHCRIIDVQYYIMLIAKPGWHAADFKTSCKIQIGTIPIRSVPHIYVNGPVRQKAGTGEFELIENVAGKSVRNQGPPPAYTETSPMSNLTEDTPNPIYERSQDEQDTVDIREEEENNGQLMFGEPSFSPMYTYYIMGWEKVITAVREQSRFTAIVGSSKNAADISKEKK